MFEKLSRVIGFTNTELKVLIFIISVFVTGLVYRTFFINQNSTEYKNFDYSSQERLFQQSGDQIRSDSTYTKDKNVDSKQEVLDFNNDHFINKGAKELPGKKSININTAGIEELIKLPGIGKQTAGKIIMLRNKKGSFKQLNELLEVKGIGSVKLKKIEGFIFINHSNELSAPASNN